MRTLYRIWIWIYLWWSKLYRLIFHRERLPVAKYKLISDLMLVYKGMLWKSDGIREFGDAIGAPGYIQYLIDVRIDEGGGVYVGDCDEFAVYGYSAMANHVPLDVTEVVGILTVSWWKPWFWGFKRPGGHHVCLVRLLDGKYAHVGNWGFHIGFETFSQAILSISRSRPLLGWFLWHYPTHVVEYDLKLPNAYSTE